MQADHLNKVLIIQWKYRYEHILKEHPFFNKEQHNPQQNLQQNLHTRSAALHYLENTL